MSSTIWSSINPATTSGTQLATILDDFKDAVMSGMTGTSRPTQTTAGGAWIDTTNEGSPNFYWSYKVYDGTVDIEVFRINLATGTASITGADSSFQIQKISADAVGPLAKFVKQRIASNGQVLTSDVIGEMRFVGRASDSSNPVVASIRVIAGENETSVASGGYIVFESTLNGAIAATEWMRLHEGKLGVGTQAPETSVHVVGTTGIKTVMASDDAVGTIVALEKTRIAGSGAVQTSDVIGNIDARAWDSVGAPAITGKLEFKATEGHTAGAKGTQASIKVAKTGESTLTEQFIVGDKIESVGTHILNATEMASQNVATTATITQLSAAKGVVEFTGSTATAVQGINSGHASKTIILHNRSTAIVTLLEQNGTAAAADRIKLPFAQNYILVPEASVQLYYCTTDTKWKLVGQTSVVSTVSKSSTYTATYADELIYCNAATAFTLTLPSSVNGKKFVIKRTDSTASQALTIDTTSSQTIDGATSVTLDFQYETITLIGDGGNWQVQNWDGREKQVTLGLGNPGGWATTRAIGLVSKSRAGVWRLKFNFQGTLSASAGSDIVVNDVTFKSGYYQAIAFYDQSTATRATYYARCNNGSNTITFVLSGTSTDVLGSGDVELDGKPTMAL